MLKKTRGIIIMRGVFNDTVKNTLLKRSVSIHHFTGQKRAQYTNRAKTTSNKFNQFGRGGGGGGGWGRGAGRGDGGG